MIETKRLALWEEARGKLTKIVDHKSSALLETRGTLLLILPREILRDLAPLLGEEVSILKKDGGSGPDSFLIRPDPVRGNTRSHPEPQKRKEEIER